MYAPSTSFFAPADSARVIGDVYSISLVATLPMLAAAVAYLFLRESNAGTRAIIWRCTLVGLLAICVGRLVPWQWMAWVLPDVLARPLVALGTVQLDVPPGAVDTGEAVSVSGAIRALLLLYWAGVALVLLRTVGARVRLMLVRQGAAILSGPVWLKRMRIAALATGVPTRAVRLLVSSDISVPVTWGFWRPIILLPEPALRWNADRLQAVLRHELTHVHAGDATMRLVARIVCALLWFHPGVWWLARRLESDSEQACDDRVLLSGVRASDYAEWLAAASPVADRLGVAMALASQSNLRARLAAVTDTRRRIAVPGRRAVFVTVALTAAIVAPLSTARLAPTRHVLTSLMRETRWESRAWAVMHLARRADSVDVARSAASSDPDPTVRAWARYALGLVPAGSVTRPGS